MATVPSGLALAVGHGGHSGGGRSGGGHFGGGHFGGSRVGVGVFIGAPFFGYYPPAYNYYPPTYYDPGYYYPPSAAVPYSPPAYIEQGNAPPAPAPYSPPAYGEQGNAPPAPAPSQANWWYYCAGTQSYYPYVRQCPGGWQRVSPQPPSPG